MKDKTATECWIILKDEIEVIIETFVLIKIKGSDLGRNTSKKKLYERLRTQNNVVNIQKPWKYGRP